MPITSSRDRIREALKDAYQRVYDQPPARFDDQTRIIKDLDANNPDQVYALTWRTEAAKTLGIPERSLPRPEEGRDYKVGELIDILDSALRASRDVREEKEINSIAVPS